MVTYEKEFLLKNNYNYSHLSEKTENHTAIFRTSTVMIQL